MFPTSLPRIERELPAKPECCPFTPSSSASMCYPVIIVTYIGFEPIIHHWWSVQFRIAACVYYYKNYWYRGIVYPHEVWWLPLLEVSVRLFLCVCLLLTLLHYFSVYRWILYWFNPIEVRACHGSYHLASNSAIYQKELKLFWLKVESQQFPLLYIYLNWL